MSDRAAPRGFTARLSRERAVRLVNGGTRVGEGRPRQALAPTKIKLDSDGLFALAFFGVALFLPMLFIADLGTLGAAIFSILALAYVTVRMRQLPEILGPRAFLLAFPVLGILSTFWSEARGETLKYSFEFSLTVGLALLLSAAPRPRAVLWGLFLAFGAYIIIALTFGGIVNVGSFGGVVVDGETAFSGLTDSKNLLADIASTGLLISTTSVIAAIEDRRIYRAMLALAIASAQTYALIEAHSAGAIIGLAPALACLVFFVALRPARLMIRLVMSVFAILCAGLGVFIYAELSGGLVAGGAALFGKDPTLTGRTYLWQRAADFIAEKPFLGKGFGAFWVQGNPDAEGLWRFAGITARAGFNFHNTLIEILVNLGWLGVAVIGLMTFVATCMLLYRVMTRPTLMLCFWFSLLIYEFARMPIESIGMAPFYYQTVLIFAALGSALVPRRAAAEAKSARRRPHRRHTLSRIKRPA